MAIASVVSKVVERIFIDRLSEYLDTMGNQFGFKPKLGTHMCIYSLKEIIGSYSKLNVKHSMLFTKPGYIVRLLMFWYAHQTMCVRWGGSVSHLNLRRLMGSDKGEFCHRFCLMYMDDLSVDLKKCPTGCIAGGTVVNHLMYADDIESVGDWSFLAFACVWKIWIGS